MFETDRRYRLPVSPAELWTTLSRVDDYQRWWPWLRGFEASHIGGHQVWHCLVQPPLPYRVRFDVRFEDVVVARSVVAAVSGDVVGSARLDVAEVDEGSEAHVLLSLEPGNGFLRAASRLAAPVIRYGHDWVIDTGARQFLDRAV